MAFFSDRLHEVKQVTSGLRVSIAYSLFKEPADQTVQSTRLAYQPLAEAIADNLNVHLNQQLCCDQRFTEALLYRPLALSCFVWALSSHIQLCIRPEWQFRRSSHESIARFLTNGSTSTLNCCSIYRTRTGILTAVYWDTTVSTSTHMREKAASM